MEDAKLGYIAGILDGEGSIMLVRACYASFLKANKYPGYFPSVRIGMIERDALDLIVSTLKIGKVVKEKSYENKRPMHRYRLTRKLEVKKFLEILLPYLLVKKNQAVLLIEYINKFDRAYLKSKSRDDIESDKFNYAVKMRELNGVASPATTEPWGKRGRSKSVRIETTV